MTDPGLNDRLRQKSRRAGLAVGLSMALAIAICIGGATLIYAALINPLSDLIPVDESAPRASQEAPIQPIAPPDDQGVQGLNAPEPAQIQEPEAADQQSVEEPAAVSADTGEQGEPEAATAEAMEEADSFSPTHQIGASQSVNFRAGPTRGDAIIIALPPSTPLRYLDEDAPTEDASDGDRWMRFETAEGQQGWIREIDVVSY